MAVVQTAPFDELTAKPPLDGRTFHTALDIRVGAKTVRSYSEVVESWRSNSNIGMGLGSAAAFTGAAVLLVHFWRRRKR
jgi:hypothetical protein